MRPSLAAFAFALAAAIASPARAIEAPAGEPVAVIAVEADRFGQRLLAELRALGMPALRLDPVEATASRASLEAAARKAGALAVIRGVPSSRGVEVWITDRATGKTVLREIGGDAESDAALAMRAVELLRASLLEASLPAAPRGEVALRREVRARLDLPAPAALAPGAPPRLRFALAPGVLASPGGFGPLAALDAGLSFMPSDHLGVAAFAAIPLTRPSAEGVAGRAALSALLLGGGVRFVLTSRDSALAPSIDAGVAALSLSLSATAKPGYHVVDASMWTAAPYVRAGLAYAPTPMLRVRADALVGAATAEITVELAKREFGTFGRPLFLASAGVDFGFF